MNDDRPVLEIEITEKMIEVGSKAACLFTPSEDGFDVMLPTIFRAMFGQLDEMLLRKQFQKLEHLEA